MLNNRISILNERDVQQLTRFFSTEKMSIHIEYKRMNHRTDQDKSSCSLLCSAVPFSVYDFSVGLRGPWLQRDPRGYRPLGFRSCILPFHPFPHWRMHEGRCSIHSAGLAD